MIPMVNLKRQYRQLKAQIDAAVLDVLENTQFIMGPNVAALEQEIADYHDAAGAVAVANGTDALRLALRACGIGPGDEVITTPFTFIATVEVILDVGAMPVFADVRPDTFNIDPAAIEACITKRTKALIPVHLFGQPAQMDAIMDLADRYDLEVIEDCAQSFGATFNGQLTGTFGDFGCFSFFPSKNLGGYGDGGMVITRDTDSADTLKMLRNHGSTRQYHHATMGYNSRLDEIQAAILRIKFNAIDEMNAARHHNAQTYKELISHADIVLPHEDENVSHVYHQFTLKSPRRDDIAARLRENEIAAALYYPVPLHRQELFAGSEIAQQPLPVSETLAEEVVSLPMFPELREDEIARIANVVNDALK